MLTTLLVSLAVHVAQAQDPAPEAPPQVAPAETDASPEPEPCPEADPCPECPPCPAPEPCPPPPPERPYQVDVELDPLNFIAGGSSLHVGLRRGVSRVDLAVYTLPVPSLLHSHPDVSVYVAGLQLRYDHTVHERTRNLYLGGQVILNRLELTQISTGLTTIAHDVRLGVQVGYRLQLLDAGLYVNPWLGVFYRAGADSYDVGHTTYSEGRIQPFPALHIGWLLG